MAAKGLWVKEIRAGKLKFGVGLMVLAFLATVIPLLYDTILGLVENAPVPQMFRDQVASLTDYQTYIWGQWFGKNLYQTGSILAVIFGAGIISSEVANKTIQFLLARPVSRRQVFNAKYVVNFLSLAMTVVVSTVILYLVVVATGHGFPVPRLIQHTAVILAGLAVIYSIAVYFSTLFDQTLKAVIISGLADFMLLIPGMFPPLQKYSVYYYMTGMSIEHGDGFPVLAFVVMLVVTAALYFLASRRFAARDL